jgi:hypothetical protein
LPRWQARETSGEESRLYRAKAPPHRSPDRFARRFRFLKEPGRSTAELHLWHNRGFAVRLKAPQLALGSDLC